MEGRATLWCAVLLSSGLCVCASFAEKTFECDFEKSFCAPYEIPSYDFWARGQGNKIGGPAIDHTYGNSSGHFAYVNVSRTFVRSAYAGPWVYGDYCIKFSYYMFGPQVGNFTVTARRNYYPFVPIFSRKGSQGDRWHEVVLSLKRERLLSIYQILYLATDDTSRFSGDVALDDIEYIKEQCPPPSAREATDLCTFDFDDCGFNVTQGSDNVSWRWSGDDSFPNRSEVVPYADHTLRTKEGNYWYASAENISSGGTVILSSPVYDALKVSPSCLSFYYYVNDDSISKSDDVKNAVLQVHVHCKQIGTIAWERNGINHKEWTYAEATIEANSTFQVDFVYSLESNTTVALAIDDVVLVERECSEAVSPTVNATYWNQGYCGERTGETDKCHEMGKMSFFVLVFSVYIINFFSRKCLFYLF